MTLPQRPTTIRILAATFLLTACGPAPTDPGPGGVTVEDAETLDKAAEKLDAEQANPSLLPATEGDKSD